MVRVSHSGAPTVTIAGRIVQDPLSQLVAYAGGHSQTVRRYDLGGSGPGPVTTADIVRTRLINSRIGDSEGRHLVRAAAASTALLEAIPPNADLRDADPAVSGGLYDQALTVFDGLLAPKIRLSKVSKVLHLKRPALFPILDSRIVRVYRQQAATAAVRYRKYGRTYRRMYWAAIRDDVVAPENVAALAALRAALHQDADEGVRLVGELSDLRLLDILTWQSGK
jgi:Family of unknown function (DUF6308)